jgi:hypothetical protein
MELSRANAKTRTPGTKVIMMMISPSSPRSISQKSKIAPKLMPPLAMFYFQDVGS